MGDNYEVIEFVGEGQYGLVLKCLHKPSKRIVAIKKLKETRANPASLREIQLLKTISHDNIVNLIDVFTKKKKLHFVFEYVSSSLLEKIQNDTGELDEENVRKYVYQLSKAIKYLHDQQIVHRDIKPENLLISESGILKLCDFGFARKLDNEKGQPYTDYVSTRWYRAPELLVGDPKYGKEVDVWALGVVMIECVTGIPLFQGRSDLDQLSQIVKCFGKLTERQMELFRKSGRFKDENLPQPEVPEIQSLRKRFFSLDRDTLDFLEKCLAVEPRMRPSVDELLNHPYFRPAKRWYRDEFPDLLENDELSRKYNEKMIRIIHRQRMNHKRAKLRRRNKSPLTTRHKSPTSRTSRHKSPSSKKSHLIFNNNNNNNNNNNSNSNSNNISNKRNPYRRKKSYHHQRQFAKPSVTTTTSSTTVASCKRNHHHLKFPTSSLPRLGNLKTDKQNIWLKKDEWMSNNSNNNDNNNNNSSNSSSPGGSSSPSNDSSSSQTTNIGGNHTTITTSITTNNEDVMFSVGVQNNTISTTSSANTNSSSSSTVGGGGISISSSSIPTGNNSDPGMKKHHRGRVIYHPHHLKKGSSGGGGGGHGRKSENDFFVYSRDNRGFPERERVFYRSRLKHYERFSKNYSTSSNKSYKTL